MNIHWMYNIIIKYQFSLKTSFWCKKTSFQETYLKNEKKSYKSQKSRKKWLLGVVISACLKLSLGFTGTKNGSNMLKIDQNKSNFDIP